jgi:hypothetical protein
MSYDHRSNQTFVESVTVATNLTIGGHDFDMQMKRTATKWLLAGGDPNLPPIPRPKPKPVPDPEPQPGSDPDVFPPAGPEPEPEIPPMPDPVPMPI